MLELADWVVARWIAHLRRNSMVLPWPRHLIGDELVLVLVVLEMSWIALHHVAWMLTTIDYLLILHLAVTWNVFIAPLGRSGYCMQHLAVL